jgi:hypothetical protein
MQELQPPCAGPVEEVNRDGSFRVHHAKYIERLFTGVNVALDQFITISHVEDIAQEPWRVAHYVLEITRPTPRG